MATLTNTQISVTYVGLLKTSANTILTSTAQQITDGSGNNSILFLSTAGVGIGGAAASGKELDVTGNVLVTGDLQVDNLNIDGNTISSTAGTDLNITPLAGQQIVLDGTIVIDAGVVTGATSITSTSFVGELTGNASTSTKIASITNSNIVQLTSSQTLTNKTIDVDNNTVSNIEVDNFKASAIVIESEGIGSNDNDTTLPTSAAVKDYVDGQVTAQDLDFAGDSNTGSVDLDSQTFTIAGTTNEIETSASGQTLTVGLPNSVTITTDIGSPIFSTGEGVNNKIFFLGNYGNWRINISDSANQLVIHSESLAADYFTVIGGGGIKLNAYGSGSKTGTVAKNLAVDSSGNIIETDGGVVDGSGTANDVAMWSDANTLTDAPIAISGNNATFAGDITATSKKFISTSSSSGDYVRLYAGSGTAQWDIYGSGENLRLSENSSGGGIFQVDSGATFGGDVTIDSSTATLNIKGSNTGSSLINFADAADGNVGRIFYDHTNNFMQFKTNDSEKLRITSAGNLGLGTDSPRNTTNHTSLTVNGSSVGRLDLATSDTIRASFYAVSSQVGLQTEADIPLIFGTGTSSTTALTLDTSQNATFAGNVTLSSGFVNLPAGTETDPSLIFAGDDDTGLWHPASNTLAFSTFGSERMRIDSSGNTTFTGSVGIGMTSTPPSPLTVVGTGVGSSGTIGIQGANAHIGFKNSSGTFRSFVGHFNATGHGSDADLNVKTGYGSVGNIRFSADGDTTAAQMFLQGSSGSVGIGSTGETYGADKLTIKGSNKGISSSPGGNLAVFTSDSVAADKGGSIVLGGTYTGTTPYQFAGIAGLKDNSTAGQAGGYLAFYTTNQSNASPERMRLDSDGNLGIGLTPSVKLEIKDSTHTTMKVRSGNDDNIFFAQAIQSSDSRIGTETNTDFTIHTNGAERIRVDTSGNVGIENNNPVTLKSATTLQVNGNAKLGDANDRGLLSLGDIASTGANAGIWRGAAGAYGSAGNFLNLGGYDGITFTTGNADISSQTLALTIDSSQRLGVGTTTPNEKLVVGTTGGTQNIEISNSYIQSFNRSGSPGYAALGFYGSSYVFNVGNVLIGKTSTGLANVGIEAAVDTLRATKTSSAPVEFNRLGTDGDIVLFYKDTAGKGSISITSSAVSYNTSSDYRLKENVVEMTGALDRVGQLKPSRFNFIGEEKTVDGFLAHEVQDIVPEAISGDKDEVDEDGNEKYQGIDQSKLVPLLVGAIQELKKEIEILKNK